MQIVRTYLNIMEKVNKLLHWTIGLLLGSIFILLVSQVLFRYVLHVSIHWTEEAARFITIWTVFLGVAVALRKKSLIAVEVIVQFVPAKIEKIFRIVVLLLSMILISYLIYLGMNLSINASQQDSTALGIPMWIPYSSIPVGSFFTLLNIFVVMIEIFKEKAKEEQIT